jgi:hypothetical protein
MAAQGLEQIIERRAGATSEWSRLGFLYNPFPSRSHPNWEVFHNQAEVRTRFNHVFEGFLQGQPTTTMFFTGGNRVGKTHFMEYHRRTLPPLLEAAGIVLPIALVLAQFCDFVGLCRQVIEQVSDALRQQTGAGLFEAPLTPEEARVVETLPPGDFRRALKRVIEASDEGDRRLLLQRWLRGERLRATQRVELGVIGHLDSTATLVGALGGLVRFMLGVSTQGPAEENRTRPGILIFVDEFELLWKHRRDRRDQFLQGLRALIDACPVGLFLCVGMATGVGSEALALERDYPALFQRLRGARATPALVEIDSVTEAQKYAAAFVENGRKRFRDVHANADDARPFLTQLEIEQLYKASPGGASLGGTVSQGDFFDMLHEYADRKLREHLARP